VAASVVGGKVVRVVAAVVAAAVSSAAVVTASVAAVVEAFSDEELDFEPQLVSIAIAEAAAKTLLYLIKISLPVKYYGLVI
jgi:hypothetical protein